jgi:methyltransferase, FkbM family
MKESLYAAFLRLPRFKGHGRLTPVIRDALFKRKPHRIIHGLYILLDPIEWGQADILRDRVAEPLTTKLFGELLKPGATYIDVGAHIGYHTLIARYHVGPSGTVFAIDPQPYNCARILENWACNKFTNLLVYVAAAGPNPAFISLHPPGRLDRSQLSLLRDENNPDSSALAFRVPIIPLSQVFSENSMGDVSLLKIDVEGFEEQVVEGLGSIISRVENIILEILGTNSMERSRSLPVLEALMRSGFNRWRTVDGLDWRPRDELPENNLWVTR